MSIKALIHKMSLSDLWLKNDFALILAEYNRDTGDEYFFRNFLYDAVKAKTCNPLSRDVPISLDPRIPSTPAHQYNFEYKKEKLLGYAKTKELKIPDEFDDLFSNQENSSDLSTWPEGREIAEMNADKALAIMAVLLSESKSAYKINNKPNCSRISEEVNKLAKQYFGEDKARFVAFYKRLAKALKLLSPETPAENKK